MGHCGSLWCRWHQGVRLLIGRGADANACTHAGSTPLMMAVKLGHTETAEALLERGAKHTVRASHKAKSPCCPCER